MTLCYLIISCVEFCHIELKSVVLITPIAYTLNVVDSLLPTATARIITTKMDKIPNF
jgi:hypothetical protein